MKKHSMRAVPAAAAMVAALVFGVQIHAQTNNGTPPGSTNPKDASATPGPAARVAADGNNSAGNSASMPPGSTKPKDALNPKTATSGTAQQRAMAKSDRASARAEKRAARASKKKTDINNSAETPGGSMSSTATSPSK